MQKGLHLPTQNERILDWLRSHETITTYEAMSELGVARLASRISDMKKQGYRFNKEFVTSKNRYGEKVSYVAYSLEEES